MEHRFDILKLIYRKITWHYQFMLHQTDTYVVYISYETNDTLLEPPTESKFDLFFILPNQTNVASLADVNVDDEYELQHTIFILPGVHLGNGTIKLFSKYCF